MTGEMTDEMMDAAAALEDVLRAENAELEAMRLGDAGAMLESKQAAVDRFLRARAAGGVAEAPAEARLVATRLGALAGENRRLLEHGIRVQGRLIGMLTRAVAQSGAADGGRYGSGGALRTATRTPAVALAARA